jgi:L-lactate dehydrogenase
MVPIWSSANIGGLPLEKYPGWSLNVASEVFNRTKTSGAEVIKKKGGAGFAVGLAIKEVIEAIALDRRCVLPVSSVQNGCYGLKNVSISVPTVVGRAGVLATREIDLWPKEVQALKQSANVLRQTIDTVLSRIGK